MIGELQVASFMREKVRLLAAVGRDIAQRLSLFDLEPGGEDIDDEDTGPFDERDIVEFLATLETMERDDAMFEPGPMLPRVDGTLGPSDQWLPRFAPAGLLQSSIDDYYRVNNAVAPSTGRYGERLVSDPLISSNVQTPQPSRTGAGRLTLNKKDPRWALVLYAKRLKRRHGRAPFPANMGSRRLPNDFRLLLVADWGSGIPGAIQVADTMRKNYILPVLGTQELHVAHLGDVYYAGLRKEYKRNFLRHWPVKLGEEHLASSWCLPGNHDMYAGGRTFFDMLSTDPRFAGQSASYFLLENDNWQVFGLDTAYEPVDYRGDTGVMYGEQAAWFARTRMMTSHKKCVLLTHHQPFSAYVRAQEDLERRVRPVADAGEITAWFWGHEHACAHYQRHNNIEHPVLIGNGGFPEARLTALPKSPPMRWEWKQVGAGGDLLFGFAVLDFNGPDIDVALVDQTGVVQHSFRIS